MVSGTPLIGIDLFQRPTPVESHVRGCAGQGHAVRRTGMLIDHMCVGDSNVTLSETVQTQLPPKAA